MHDRFSTLGQRLAHSHIALNILDRTLEENGAGNAPPTVQRILIMTSLTIRDLRAQIVEKLAQEGAKRSDYALILEGQPDGEPLSLDTPINTLRPGTTLIVERVDHQEAVEDTDIILLFDDDSMIMVDKLPCVIGRSKQDEGIEVNLQDFPESLTVSRRHAELAKKGGKVTIRALGDKPVYVNEQPGGMLPLILTDNDTVRLGKVSMRVRLRPKEAD